MFSCFTLQTYGSPQCNNNLSVRTGNQVRHHSIFGDGREGMYSIADIISRVHCTALHAHVEGKLEKTQQNIR